MATGWTWDVIDDLTVPRLRALERYWQRYPPIHQLLAWRFGLKPDGGSAAAGPAAAPRDDLGSLIAQLGVPLPAPKE